MERRDSIILDKILKEIAVAEEMLGSLSLDAFVEDEKLKRAICMTVINIGELVKGLTVDFKKEYSSIPWKDIAGFRDIAAHKYQTLGMEDVYITVTTDFPQLALDISQIINPPN